MESPPIPEEIGRELDSLRTSASAAFQVQNWELAANKFGEGYAFLLEQQSHYRIRFHKGWELYNWGVSLLRIDVYQSGIEKVLLAYVEDVLSAEPGKEESTHTTSARMSFLGMSGSNELLDSILTAAAERKTTDTPFEPDEVLATALNRSSVTIDALVQGIQIPKTKKRTIEGLDFPFERRCFVGGNYFSGGSNLADISEAVRSAGYDAIMAIDFEISDEEVHHRSLLLLHLCCKAIFEITSPAGQLMELERCRDYSIEPLLLRQVMPSADAEGAAVSAMIHTMTGAVVHTYSTIDEARVKITEYLG